MTNRLAIRVHVKQKRPLSELTDTERFPEEVAGIPVDVIEAEYGLQTASGNELAESGPQLEAAKDGRGQRFDDIPLGVSVGSRFVTAGTLGAKVFDAQTLAPMILSNWHVLAGSPSATVGEPIRQPGVLDGGSANDAFATLTRFVLGPYDAAVATLTDARPVQTTTLEGEPVEDVTAPGLGMMVWKSGRTTGRTEGFIDGIKMTASINYGAAGVKLLRDVVRIVPRPGAGNIEVSLGGDSGSVWLDENSGKAIGLHFAGEVGDAPEHALANEMSLVAEHLGVLFPALVPDSEPDPEPIVPDPDPVTPTPPPEPTPVIPTEPPQDPDPDPSPPPPLSFWEKIWQFLRNLFR